MGVWQGAHPYFSMANQYANNASHYEAQRAYMERMAAERDRVSREAKEPVDGGELKPIELLALPAPDKD